MMVFVVWCIRGVGREGVSRGESGVLGIIILRYDDAWALVYNG